MSVDWKAAQKACEVFAEKNGYIPFEQWMPDSKQRWLTAMRTALTAALALEQEDAPGSFRRMLDAPSDEPAEIKLAQPEISRRIPLRAAHVAAPVQVKALEWQPMWIRGSSQALGAAGRYIIHEIPDHEDSATFHYEVDNPFGRGNVPYTTLEAAKAAAQADYEQRIRSALVADTSREDVVREALEHAREKMWEYGFSEDDLQPIRDALRSISGDTSNG